jgi:hypothetical protein
MLRPSVRKPYCGLGLPGWFYTPGFDKLNRCRSDHTSKSERFISFSVTLSAFLRKLNPIARHNTLCGACPLRAQPREYNESILSGPQVTPNSETLCGGKALHLVWLNYRGAGEPKYNVGFSDYASTQVAKIHRKLSRNMLCGSSSPNKSRSIRIPLQSP